MAPGPPSIVVEELGREFDGVTALDSVDFEITERTVLGVVGPNGSGKTTLIRCLLGLIAPTAGSAQVGRTAPRAFETDDRRSLGYMPQRSAVYRDLTIRQNVAFFARLYHVPDRAAAVDRALDLVDLRDRSDDRIDDLSGGMVRRTSLACALVHEPSLLFLDEPTVGLDPELRASMWEAFRNRRDDGATVVLSTHYLGEADRCDWVLLLRAGRALAIDTPQALRERTETDDIEAAFLGLLAEADR